ncbi:hypothetical protein LMG7974_01310 [Campylobacter majalis]|uniref:Neutral zinc metallopeptidase n=1 Tax=Campylobacter majalis TaxID=2790656 RepID=A0ABM8Q7Y1_9BACT|nr:neutral zinc metallopeptidase [Campylobacter majalis]CAD7289054.1 hypothetical protein LMG7974_01310 [Campylobacter majalis]
MRWRDSRRSSNIEDRRSGGGFGSGRIGSLLPIIRFLLGSNIGRVVLGLGVVAYFMGYNPLALLDLDMSQTSSQVQIAQNEQENERFAFVSAVLAQTEDVWSKIFKDHGATYVEPNLVVFREQVRSACGFASSQSGPFYCPADHKVYLDLSFFDELAKVYKASGDFAQAYVIAHEIGHHVQNLSGTLDKIQQLKARSGNIIEQNALQVRVELQADCYAGIWAKHINSRLEDGDIQEALNAASAIGDDTLQRKFQGHVVPDSFTHGSSKQRMQWFKKGFLSGKIEACAF